MNTQQASVTPMIAFLETAVQFAQYILRSEQADDITAIRDHGQYAAANQTVPTAVWSKSVPAFGRLAKKGQFAQFMTTLREQDEASYPRGSQAERFENTVAKLVFRHTRTRR